MKVINLLRVKKKSLYTARVVVVGAIAIIFAFVFFYHFDPVLATTNQLNTVGEAADLNNSPSLPIIVARVIQALLGFIGIIFTGILIYAGFLYLTAKGEAAHIDQAKKMLTNAVIGLMIIIFSFSITTYILSKLLEASGLGGAVTSEAANYTEPLSGSLGSGIIDSHYPARDATDVPRNTKIMVTFKEAIDYNSIISNYDAEAPEGTVFYLKNTNVLIYPTDQVDEGGGITAESIALASTAVEVTATTPVTGESGPRTFVFAPVDYLGSSTTNTDYTVKLKPTILKADGREAFSGSYDGGYEWTFEVSTEIDLTPPTVVSIIPTASTTQDRNVVVSITFSEAMDPVAASGIYGGGGTFNNIEVLSGTEGSQLNTDGTFSISNAYKTVEFVPVDICGEDPCGDEIYCLPPSTSIETQAHAASVGDEAPQASSSDGLVDAANNSLDGDADGIAEGSTGDDKNWSFTTTADINSTVPYITTVDPSPKEGDVDVGQDIAITFSILMQSSTLNTDNVSLEPDHTQELWFSNTNTSTASTTTVTMDHATLWEKVLNRDGVTYTQYYYYPLVTNDAKSNWQICMLPSNGPKEGVGGSTPSTVCGDSTNPYCCSGSVADDSPCVSINGNTLGD